MRKKIIAGNWKMNGTRENVRSLLGAIKRGLAEIKISNLQWIVFPPYVFLDEVADLISNSTVALGAQNLSQYASGAYTGEISASMLREFHCTHVLVGHSERRNLFAESDEVVAAKFLAAVRAELIPVLCVGETLNARQRGVTKKIIENQLQVVIKTTAAIELFQRAIVAYEPVWAIGTGVNATPEQAQEVHSFIRQIFVERNPQVAENLQILYGGSLKPDNAKDIFAMPDIDGGLIGGASLKADDFLNIGKAVCNL